MPEYGEFYYCAIQSAGPAEDGKIYIQLRDINGKFPWRWFSAVASQKKEMLATALAAIQMNAPVSAAVASTTENSQINRLYVIQRNADQVK